MKIGKFKKIAAIGLALTMAIGLICNMVDTKAVNYTQAGPLMATPLSQEQDDGVVLNKTAKYNRKTNSYDITLEAYANGNVRNITKPVDVLLILDQSGSMDNKYNDITYNDLDVNLYENMAENENDWSSQYPYYISIRGDNYVLHHDSGGWYYGSRYNKRYIVPSSSGIYITRQGALVDVLASNNGFLDKLSENSANRIGMMTFATRKNDNYTNGNFQNIVSVKENLKSYLYNMDASGSTYPSGAFESANNNYFNTNYFNNPSNEERGKVVVFFTDGEPGYSGGYVDWGEAGPTIDSSQTLKKNGVTVYSLGILDGMDPTSTWNDVDKFMHGVSSNYPNADWVESFYGSHLDLGNRYQTSNGTIPNYYLTANNSSGLNDIFNSIFDQFSDAKINATSVITDKISDYFDLPEGISTGNLKGKVVAYKVPYQSGGFNEADKTIITNNVGITIDSENKTVSVTGFDYVSEENMVITDQGKESGYKLQLKILDVKPTEDFIGGNAVPTNAYANITTKGEQGEEAYHKDYNVPEVDVSINYDMLVNDAAMYVGDNWDDFRYFIESIGENNNVKYKINGEDFNINGINNKFVDITYTIKDGDKIIGTYKITGKNNQHQWIPNSELKNYETKTLRNDHEFTVSVSVVANKGEIDDTLDNITPLRYIENSKNTHLYLYIPNVESYDQSIMLGENVNLTSNDVIKLSDKGWTPMTADVTVEPTFNGEKDNAPDLIYVVSGNEENVENNIFTPTKDGDYTFNYTIKNRRTNEEITSVSKANQKCTNLEDNSTEKKFIVHVSSGSITIGKILDTKDLNVDKFDGTPIFTFKVEKIDGGNVVKTYYKTVELKEINGVWETDAVTIDGLEKGTYKVTELPSMRYKFAGVKVNNSGTGKEEDGQTVKLDIDAPEATYEYTNEVKDTKYDSDNGYLVNKVIKKDDGSYSMVKNQSSER